MKKLILLTCVTLVACGPALAAREENIPEAETKCAMPEDVVLKRMETAVASDIYQNWCKAHPAPFQLFGEERRFAVRRNIIPAHWFAQGSTAGTAFRGVAQPGEFYSFQVCVASASARKLAWRAETDLAVTCITPAKTAVQANGVKPIWVMVDIPKDAAGKTFSGKVHVTDTASGETRALPFSIAVSGPVLADGGIHDGWRLARLKWLCSDLGSEDTVTKGYTPVAVDAATRTIQILGRDLVLGADGLPAQVVSHFSGSNTRLEAKGFNLLAQPISVAAKGLAEPAPCTVQFAFTEMKQTRAAWRSEALCGTVKRIIEGSIDFTGKLVYRVRFEGGTPQGVTFEMRVPGAVGRYFEGLGRNGDMFPNQPVVQKWTTAYDRDAVWFGRANGGFAVRFKGKNYRPPFVNAYYKWRPLLLPESWAAGNGTITAAKEGDGVVLRATSGQAPAGAEWNFDLYITPFHTLDMRQHLKDHYAHLKQHEWNRKLKDFKALGCSIVNVHHNTLWNPYINYPYNDDGGPHLKKLVQEAHDNNLLLKVYYTTRELTQNLPEFFALMSLDGEVLAERDASVQGWPVTNRRGPNPWIRDHVGLNIVPAWRETVRFNKFYPPRPDLAVLTTPATRWDNFYLGGLDYLVREYGIDGLYIDDTALTGAAMQRARRILDRDGRRRVVDNHSWNHHSSMAGGGSSNLVFIDLYPYFDLLWRGEGFGDNMPAAFWLVERSGAVFGLPGELLGRCNQMRGMMFGMTDRLDWGGGRPCGLWKFFDQVDLPNAEFIGWWDDANPTKVASDDIKVTTWIGKKYVVLVANSFAKKPVTAQFTFDTKKLGLDPTKAKWVMPPIAGVQNPLPIQEFSKPVTIGAGGGFIIYAEK